MHRPSAPAAGPELLTDVTPPGVEEVVLLDAAGVPCGRAAKADVHGPDTQLHLALSCYVVDRRGRLLLTRRSRRKRTWPGVWTNSCCGHPQPGETIREAAQRRIRQELGLEVEQVAMAFPDFSYRAVMDDGTVEHELCPVVVAAVDGDPVLDPFEVEDARWVSWPEFESLARRGSNHLSPWAIAQARRFAAVGAEPAAWLVGRAPHVNDPSALRWPGLDVPADERPVQPSVRSEVERRLRRFLDARADELRAIDARAHAMSEVVTRLVELGGKRIRPEFVYWGHRATGAAHDDALPTLGAAVELLHTFALVHDDVMDRSDTRRGAPTAHVALRALHRDADAAGDAEWFGVSAAIVAGDLAHVWAQQLFDDAVLPVAARERARAVFFRLQSEVMAGQYLDLELASRRLDGDLDDAVDHARRVALLKSGRYTVTRPLQLGAAVAGVDADLDERLTRYGDSIGVAFQLRDDVLGLVGDPDKTGKSCADDLREGKRTVLVLRTLQRATPRDRSTVLDALGDPDVDDAACAAVRAVVERSGALDEIEAEIAARTADASAVARELPQPAQDALLALARSITQRDR